jgi:hypothetical protein
MRPWESVPATPGRAQGWGERSPRADGFIAQDRAEGRMPPRLNRQCPAALAPAVPKPEAPGKRLGQLGAVRSV